MKERKFGRAILRRSAQRTAEERTARSAQRTAKGRSGAVCCVRCAVRSSAVRCVLCALLLSAVGTLASAQLGRILKGGAVALAVDKFGPQIDKGINSLMNSRSLSTGQATKVVPILSIGSGGYLGAVQVTGPETQLDKVKAVAQLEGRVNVIGGIRLRALIPIAARSVSNLQRVPGVGVSALVDIKL
jgi:hypothetical protein